MKNSNFFTKEIVISLVLRWGVLVSGTVIFIGMALVLARHNTLGTTWDLRHLIFFDPAGRFYTPDLGVILSQAVRLDPFAIIEVGLLLLIAAPVMRVAVSILLFALEKDKLYVIITSLVLAILLFSIFHIQ